MMHVRLAVAALVVLASGCASPDAGPTPVTELPVSTVSINPGSGTLSVGETRTFSALTKASDNQILSDRAVSWSSSDQAVATVTSGGFVTAIAPGSVLISATSEGAVGAVMLTVTVPVASVTIESSTTGLVIGGTTQLAATVLDGAGGVLVGRALAWSSNNTAVATVNATTGAVTAVGAGTATITATSEFKSSSLDISVVASLNQQTVIAASNDHTCAVTRAGTVYCWGVGYLLGQGTNAQVHTNIPLKVPGLSNIVSIAAGSRTTYVLTADGKIYGWGDTFSYGIGDGSVGIKYAPVLVSSTPAFKSISAMGTNFVALTNDGTPYQWTPGPGGAYILQPVNTTLKFAQISAGLGHTLALTAAGAAYAWGGNYGGELGDGTQTPRSGIVAVTGGKVFKLVAGGASASYALDMNGALWVWGSDSEGTLGTGIVNDVRTAPFALPGGRTYASIWSNGWRTFAITTDGAAFAWGTSLGGISRTVNTGGLGIGGDYISGGIARTPTAVLGGKKFTQIAATELATNAITVEGDAWSWGYGGLYQIGPCCGDLYAPATLAPFYEIVVSKSSMNVEAGKSTSFTVKLVKIPGAFTINGPREFNGTVNLSGTVPAGSGLTITFAPPTLDASNLTSTVTLTAGSATGSYGYLLKAESPGNPGPTGLPPSAGGNVTVQPPAVAGQMDLVCPSGSATLPTGFQCMTNSAGQHVPGKYNYPAMHGAWVDSEAGVCLNWGSDGKMTGKYKPGSFGAGSTMPQGEWGVIVKRNGTPEGTTTQWYVFSESADAQLQLLGYDSAANKIIGWHFTKQSACPSW